jgi:hypothetical protein
MATSSSTFNYHDLEHETVKRGQYTNPLLIRRPFGQVKPTTYSLPSEDFTYGLPYQRDPEGAAELTGYWQFHQPSADPKSGKITFKETDFQYHLDNHPRYGTVRVDPVTTIRFGRPTVPSPPAELLTSAQYQRDYLAQREAENARYSARQRSQFIAPQATRASMGHHKPAGTPETKELWKMSQFRQVSSRVSNPHARYAPPPKDDRPTYSFDAGRFPVVRAGMPQGLGSHQYPELPSTLPHQPTTRIQGLASSSASFTNSSKALQGNQATVNLDYAAPEEKEQEQEAVAMQS